MGSSVETLAERPRLHLLARDGAMKKQRTDKDTVPNLNRIDDKKIGICTAEAVEKLEGELYGGKNNYIPSR